MTNKLVHFAEMTPEQALELAARLTQMAHCVIEARKTKPDAYSYVSQEGSNSYQCRIRVGSP
jgi:hypothetical protein